MEKVIRIDEREVGFKATALTPRLYRHKMGRDIIQDLNKLRKAYNKAASLPETATGEEREDAQLSGMDLEIFENVSFIMARQYDANIPPTPEEWLDSFNTFSIYEVLPSVLELWAMNEIQTAKSKKK
nr:MAG TPA: tail assembly chaperone protein [Caudoviricetes sp.]